MGNSNTDAGFKTIGPAWFRHRGLSTWMIFFRTSTEWTRHLRSRCVLILAMTDRPASWRMPSQKQMEKLAAEAGRKPAVPAAAPEAPLPDAYRHSVLNDPHAGATGTQMRQRRLSEIQRHLLRVSCRRCERTLEVQTADAVRLYGGNAVWNDVAQRLLDNTCQQRTGRHEEDGCWPAFDAT
jgi:hypothetical protein